MAVENLRDVESRKAQELKDAILELKRQRNAVIMAHYYVDSEIQDMADHVGDSLALAQIARSIEAPVIVMCGVHFMAETTKILCPEKIVLEPAPDAGCSLAESCPPEEFAAFVAAHPGHTVVSYVNTSAAVKALTDIVVTSGNALKIVKGLPEDTPVIFGPDRNLGNYINSMTGREMLLWDGACHVHEQFSVEAAARLKKENPDAELLVHPECRKPLQLLADKIGSTAVLLRHAEQSPCRRFIVATESGILHQMRTLCPDKEFIPAPASGASSSTCGCNECAYMKLNTLEKIHNALRDLQPQIEIDPDLAAKARRPIEAMLERSV